MHEDRDHDHALQRLAMELVSKELRGRKRLDDVERALVDEIDRALSGGRAPGQGAGMPSDGGPEAC